MNMGLNDRKVNAERDRNGSKPGRLQGRNKAERSHIQPGVSALEYFQNR